MRAGAAWLVLGLVGCGAGGIARSDGGPGLIDLERPRTPGDPGAAEVRVEVTSRGPRRRISPLIYGTNQPTTPQASRYTVLRLGGSRLTAYNWENNASNGGSDHGFQNDAYLSTRDTPGEVVRTQLASAAAIGAAALLTVPLVDAVAADKRSDGDVRATPDYLTTRFRRNRALKGAALASPPDATDAWVSQDEFVGWVKAHAGSTPVLFSLDNEPDLWSRIHAEVHPGALTSAELVSRTLAFARAIKGVWPEAEVTGFVASGYAAYQDLDLPGFLAQLAAARDGNGGHRLVDYLDLHWYPEASAGGVRVTRADASPAVVLARVQAPRSLWDPSYVEASWITSSLHGPIQLLPWLRGLLAAHDPGLKLAVTEWNYGAGGSISGAVASADVLGIFGRDGVDLATHWKLDGEERFTEAAFAAYRNFDGAGGAFGDTALSATSSAVASVTAYASLDQADPGRTVVVLINKDPGTHTVGLTLAHPSAYPTARVYHLTQAGGPTLVPGPDLVAVALNAFRPAVPGLSVTVLEARP
jgi:hypothetical protein